MGNIRREGSTVVWKSRRPKDKWGVSYIAGVGSALLRGKRRYFDTLEEAEQYRKVLLIALQLEDKKVV